SLAKLVATCNARATTIASTAFPQRTSSTGRPPTAAHVPTNTGTTAAGRVRTRAPRTQRFAISGGDRSRSARELAEVGSLLVLVRVTPVLRFLGLVEEQRRVPGQLLDAGEPVVGGVHRRLDHAQRHRRHLEHLGAPLH